MALDYIIVFLSLIIICVYLAVFFILFDIKEKIASKFRKSIGYFIISVLLLILLRIQSLLNRAELLVIPYSQEVLATFLAFFIFLTVFSIYKSVIPTAGNLSITTKKRYRI